MSFNKLCTTNSPVKGWRTPVSSSCLFCKVQFLQVGIQFCTSSHVVITHAKWTWYTVPDRPPFDRWICHAKLIETHQPSVSLSPQPGKIYNSAFSAGTYHGQRVINLRPEIARSTWAPRRSKIKNSDFGKGSINFHNWSYKTFQVLG